MKTLTTNKLFTPIQVGPMELKHRVVMGPLTRSRSVQPGNIPGDLMLEYYSQRASGGGLIVSEATSISVAGGGWFAAPGLYSEEQVAGWKRITAAVHQKRGYMFSQLWHTGRAGHVDSTKGAIPVSSSVNPEYCQDPTILESTPHGWRQPSPHRALDITEIPGIVEDYRKASEHAKAAGFDGVELHAGNGYLPDQFLQDGVNRRTDMYGGSIENPSRFLLQVMAALVSVWGGNRVAVRIAPGGRWNGMSDSDPDALFDYVVKELNRFGLAYLHIIEPRVGLRMTMAHNQVGPCIELERCLPSEVAAISPFVDRLMLLFRKCGCVSEGESGVEIALREALANAIIHGNHENPGKHVHVRCRCEPEEILIAVKDEGGGFDVSKIADPTAPENTGSVHGRGIYLMKALMDEVRFEEGGVVVHMRKSTGQAVVNDAQRNSLE